MDIAGVDVEIDVIKEYPELEDLVVNPSTEDQNFNSSKYGFKSVKINAIKGEELDLTPSTEEQVATGVFSKVKVNPIESKKLSATPTMEEQVITGLFDTVVVNPIETEELYAIPSTEEQVKTGLFNTVVVSPIQGETLNLAPSEEQQSAEGVFTQVNINPIQVEERSTDLDFSSSDTVELTAKEGVYIKKAIINKDVNLTPENIKSGVSVCGIAGDVADTSDADATSDDIAIGKTAYVNNQKVTGILDVKVITKGMTINECDANGYPTDVSIVNMTAIPASYMKNQSATVGLFINCSKIKLPEGLTSIGSSSFGFCSKLRLTELPEGLTSIGSSAFDACSYMGLTKLPEELTSIGTYAFRRCTGLKITKIPSGITRIEDSTFYNCASIQELTLEGDVSYIGGSVFQQCYSLKKLVLPNITTVTKLGARSSFQECPILTGDGYVYVPDNLVESFKVATNWSSMADKIKGVSELV